MKQKLMGMLFSAIFWSFLLPNAQAMTIEGKGFQQMKIGDIEAVVLSDGYIRISPIQPFMAPDITSKQLSDFLKGNNNDTQSIDLAMNILLLKKGDKFILFDCSKQYYILSNYQSTNKCLIIKNLVSLMTALMSLCLTKQAVGTLILASAIRS